MTIVSDFLSCVLLHRLQKGTWSSVPPLTTHSLCGKIWSTSLFASTSLSPTPSMPLTFMVQRL